MKKSQWFVAVLLLVSSADVARAQFAGGSGSVGNPFQVATAAQLQAIESNLNAHYVLVGDIDLTGFAFDTISPGTLASSFPLFQGTLDGAGYRILNLTLPIPAAGQINGLFGKVGPSGILRDVHLVDIDVNGTTCVAGLTAENRGLIERCSVTGTVNGTLYVGGLVGDNRADVVDCYSRATVIGVDSVGGLIGVNFLGSPPHITRCYAAGPVMASINAGGLVGSNIASTPQIVSSFWDINVTGQTTSAGGGTGQSTAQMLSAATYTGWDFVSTWCIEVGVSYPENYGCVSVPSVEQFVRGDANGDQLVNIADAISVLDHLFGGPAASPLLCHDAADTNDDGSLDIADAVLVLDSLFGTPPATLPYPNAADGCGADEAPSDPSDALDCASHPCTV